VIQEHSLVLYGRCLRTDCPARKLLLLERG
jgi:hypothetical protein